jgi:two-component system response regulator HydG
VEFDRQQAVHRDNSAIALELNARQRKALPVILENGDISRSEYQQVVGNGLPVRTAIYDLQDLVRKGFLKKTGRGPATRYFLVNLPDFAR